MTTRTPATDHHAALGSGARTAMTAAGLVGALGAAGYISGVIFLTGWSDAEAMRAHR